ncbi:aldo/keto reductase [Pedobacter chinensis]|uniref:aldo/keto reductase n=1 Tax=Pedobacter chinensis TaxID=2282421 RepID=UPI001F46EB14|nr:aldo/keto reductase [Pedobacter chinensis]
MLIVTAAQSKYSLFERTVEECGVLNTLTELGIGFVAYSPLGHGFLSGQIHSIDDLPEKDFRRAIPRFQETHFYKNIELVKAMEELAKQKDVTSSQLNGICESLKICEIKNSLNQNYFTPFSFVKKVHDSGNGEKIQNMNLKLADWIIKIKQSVPIKSELIKLIRAITTFLGMVEKTTKKIQLKKLQVEKDLFGHLWSCARRRLWAYFYERNT